MACAVGVVSDELLQLSEKLDAAHNIEEVTGTLHHRVTDTLRTLQQNMDQFITAVRPVISVIPSTLSVCLF